ncbi:protein TolB [Streptomyces sp. p1417]|uniref:Protein TolB n=1 Tax=Streptomyces typhae TaxID=2681492 RepID=A0A6L6X5Q7_9ACTN|nr:protein TolB [Streptomyces typhae]MVO88829.1 protein TolB [Streptomyces typhae]
MADSRQQRTTGTGPRSRISRAALTAALTAVVTAGGPTAAHAGTAPAAHQVDRVSVATDGTQANDRSERAVLSRNGAYTAFYSLALNLTQDPPPHPPGTVYLRDNATGEVERIHGALSDPSVSDDGRYVTHQAFGPRLPNVKLLDRETGRTKLITDSPFKAASGDSSLSADGRYVAFTQHGSHPSIPDRVEVYDRVTDTYEVIAESPGPDAGPDLNQPSLSADGRYVAYRNARTQAIWLADRAKDTRTQIDNGGSSRLVELSGNGRVIAVNTVDGAYVRDIRTGVTTRFAGARADALSPDGRHLLYRSGDAEPHCELRLRHLPSGKETVVQRHARAVPGAVADRGRIVFDSPDADVVPGDTNGTADVYLWKRR